MRHCTQTENVSLTNSFSFRWEWCQNWTVWWNFIHRAIPTATHSRCSHRTLLFTPREKDDIFSSNNRRRHVGKPTYWRQEADFTVLYIFQMFVLKAAVKKVLLLFTRRRSTKLLSNRTVKMIIVNFVLLVITPLITRVISTNAPMGPLKVKNHKGCNYLSFYRMEGQICSVYCKL